MGGQVLAAPPRSARDGVPGRGHAIPGWYHHGMTRQIAVRLPEDIVEFVDSLVSDGAASSRAMVVNRALERERRRTIAARDAAILVRAGDDPELQRLTEHLARAPLDLQ